MDIAVRKRELIDWLTLLKDEAKLEKLFAFKAELEDGIIAYSAMGEPLNIDQYKAHVNEGLQDIKAGRVTAHDDFIEEVKSW